MTLDQIESDIDTGFADAKTALAYVNQALPVIEAVDPTVGADVQIAVNAANKLVPVIGGLLGSNDIDQPTHDALQSRVATVANTQPESK